MKRVWSAWACVSFESVVRKLAATAFAGSGQSMLELGFNGRYLVHSLSSRKG